MRQALAKKLFAGSITAVTALLFGLMPAAPAFGQTYPILKVTGGDVSAGGWFGDSCNVPPSPFQDATYTANNTITDKSAGGIYTYAVKPGGSYSGSSSQYAAFAQGVIDKSGTNGAFFSSAVSNPATLDTLSFANYDSLSVGANFAGGVFGGGSKYDAHCIPDFFTDKMPSATVSLTPPNGLINPVSGIGAYKAVTGASPFHLSNTDLTVLPSTDVSVFIDGSVYIDHNITYASGRNATNIPRFALVAKGDIFVAGNVTNLDGLYIAQPDFNDFKKDTTVNDNNSGVFSTCHSSVSGIYTLSFIQNNCLTNRLTVNGAVVAKQVDLIRMTGDVSNNSAPAEVFNYSPEMVLGGPFFPGATSSSASTGEAQFARIISLPPVF